MHQASCEFQLPRATFHSAPLLRQHLTNLDERTGLVLQRTIRESSSDVSLLSTLVYHVTAVPAPTLSSSRALCDVYLALLIASVGPSTAQRRRTELLLSALATNLLSLAVTSEGSRLLGGVLGCIPSSKILVAGISTNFRLLATHAWGAKVVVAAMGRANSQALGALEALIRENLVDLIRDVNGRAIIEHVVTKEKSILSHHPQIPSFATILTQLDRSSLVALIKESEICEILVDIALLAPVDSGFARHALAVLKCEGAVLASVGTRRFVAAVILGLGLLSSASASAANPHKSPLVELN